MNKILLVILLLAPFMVWDATVYFLRARGDTSTERRAEILRHFTGEDIATGRGHLERHNRMFPFYRLLFYAFYAAVLFGGLGARLESALMPVTGGRWYLALPVFVLVLLTVRSLLYMPLLAWSEFVIQRQAGLSTISVGLWLADRLKSLALGWVIVTLVALPVLALVKSLPGSWWLPAGAVVLAVSAFGIWISPWVIDPLFNKFTPLEQEGLDERIRSLSAGAGLPVKHVYQMDASRRSLYLNAYFTGLANSRRVVLYDTLVRACTQEEVLSVVAHELGHWKGRHILKGFLLEVIGVMAGLWFLYLMTGSGPLCAFFGLPGPSSLVLVLLLPFLVSLASTVTSPVVSAVSRKFEREADRTALELTADPEAFIELEKKLVRRAKADLLYPKVLHLFYGSHPLAEERIQAAEKYARENLLPAR
ncbi:MAG: M48 family metallopeptidase [Gemmatimonadota bacterium]|nr:M48 family metallopeptidase [Gemmatimonadota bacterium]